MSTVWMCLLGQSLSLSWPLLSPPEPFPRGREVVGHLLQRPWGMTHISRQTPGDHCSPITHSHKAHTDTQDAPSITGAQTDPPRDTQSYTRGQLSRSRHTCSSSERPDPG